MKNYFLSACLFLFAALNCLAADAGSPSKHYDFGLLFSVKDFGKLTTNNFDIGLGVQFELNEKSALRLLGGINVYNQTTPKPANAEKDLVHSETAISFEPTYRINLINKKNIRLYSGILGLVQWRTSKDDGFGFKSLTIDESELSVGGGVCLGAEWFPAEEISIAAEYQLIIRGDKNYKYIDDGSNTQSNIMPFALQLNLGSSNARVIIGFHF